MRLCLLATVLFVLLAVVVYWGTGRWVARRALREGADRADRLLTRAEHRAGTIYGALTAALTGVLLFVPVRVPAIAGTILVYAAPLLWLWLLVAGTSWLEITARGLDAPLFRYHRFDAFATFLLVGQRLPFLSAAVLVSADLERGGDVLRGVALHFVVAVALGLALRWLVVNRLVRNRAFPDAAVERRVRDVAKRTGLPVRRLLLVPTERGQSVNAIAATSSKVIYVAQGLEEGLGREELTAVILHELGHFSQPLVNAFKDVAILGWPALIWAFRALPSLNLGHGAYLAGSGLALLGLAGYAGARALYRASERRADRFAERWCGPGALASALRKMYEQNRLDLGGRSRRKVPALEERLGALERSVGESELSPRC